MFEVTFLPILLAGIASLVLGFIWHHPRVFGSYWMRYNNFTPDQAERGKKKMPLMAFLALLASMVAAYVLNHFGIAWGVFDWIGAVELGIWVWIGFVAPPMLGMVLWEQKPDKYFAVVAGFWLVSFIVMGLVLVLLA